MRVYLIAEIGITHGGSVKLAEEMIHRSRDSHANMVKFQYFHTEELGLTGELAEQVKRCELSLPQLKRLQDTALRDGLVFLCTPMATLPTLLEYADAMNTQMIKVREADGRKENFVKAAVKTGRTLLISVDPRKGLYFKPCKNSYLLYCLPMYPPKTADFNHAWASAFEGFSSHYPHITFDKIAVREARAAGKETYFVEVHVTPSHDFPCLDRKVSIDFEELAELASYAHRERK